MVLRARENAVGNVLQWFYRQGRVLLVTFCSGFTVKESAVGDVLQWL